MIPEPGKGLPPMERVDRRSFWPRFEGAAPWALRLGFRVATYIVAGLAPFLLGHRHVFHVGKLAGQAKAAMGHPAAEFQLALDRTLLADVEGVTA